MIGWEDAPHLQPPHITKEELDDLERDMLPHQKAARRQGRPSLGAGAIYPVEEDKLLVEPFRIPDFWPRGWALDPGWNVTAALVGAHDPDADVYYLTAEYYGQRDRPVIHSHAIKAMLPWASLEGCIDPAGDNVGNLSDGSKMREEYEDLGLQLTKANNAVHSGLRHCLVLMETGRLKVFRTLTYWLRELRLYRRNEKGKIIKANDHLMDDMRYLLNTSGAFVERPIPSTRRGSRGEW
jgi:hypothetical protein